MTEVDPEIRKLIRQKARTAAHSGIDAALWRDWRATVASTGLPMDVAVGLLNREAQRWYARFCFDEGLDAEGIDAYERLLADNREAKWIYGNEAERYLAAVRAARGPAGVVAAYERFAAIDPNGYPSLQRLVADAEAAGGRVEEAAARMRGVAARYHTDGESHLALARHALAAGEFEEARRHLRAAAKRGVVADPAAVDLAALEMDHASLAALAAEFATPDHDVLLRRFIDHPGLTLLPAEPGTADAVHTYGGDGGFELPACPCCGRTVLLLGAIDTAAAAKDEPTLAPLAAALPRLPVLHCDNCQMMFGGPDYRIDEAGRRIEVFGIASLGPRNPTFDSDKRPAPQPARLVRPQRITADDPWNVAEHLDRQRDAGPQFGGHPRPINSPRRRFCPRCDAEQTFYAAVCTTDAFATPVVVNPDGYMYFFACPTCRILSTDLDNT